jgi:hypothetical protein
VCRASISAQSSGAEQTSSLPVSFSTQRNAGMSWFEPSRIPAWLAPVCDERVAVLRHPARELGRVAVAQGALQHGQRETVDLEEDDPRHVGAHLLARAARDPLDDADRVRVVVVRPEEDVERDADRGRGERGDDRPAERRDLEPSRRDPGCQLEHRGVEEQHEKEAEQGHVGQPGGREHGRQNGVQDRDHERGDDGAAVAVEGDAGHDRRGEEERRGGDEPVQQQVERADARTFHHSSSVRWRIRRPRTRTATPAMIAATT